MPEVESIQLKDLRFTRHKRNQRTNSLPAAVNHAIAQERSSAYKPQFEQIDATPYERLAADKPGGKLAPEGTIWQIYVDEAMEHDNELVERENENLDMMLLFAALFSAILTLFIIESKNMLQEDTAASTVELLFFIAQSQQRIEQGTPKILPAIERPSFSASTSARWINGLWFTALSLSLAAALIAMLAKEWLATFKTSRPRPAYAHAMVHQERLNGLTKWRALHMIDVLPTMLHLSLLLFSLGLAVYLQTLDEGVAIAEVIIAGATVSFYIGTAFLGAIYPSCPFVTQISKYIRSFVELLTRQFRPSTSPDNATDINSIGKGMGNDEELRALWWLAENARDPVAGDCVCQVLTGVSANPFELNIMAKADRESPMASASHLEDSQLEATNIGLQSDSSMERALMKPGRYRLVKNLFNAVLARITEGRLRLPQEPAEQRGINLAQYLIALPNLVYILEEHAAISRSIKQGGSQKTGLAAESAAVSAFKTVDLVWNGAYSELSPDSYAVFSSAELQLIQSATWIRRLDQKLTTNPTPMVDQAGPKSDEVKENISDEELPTLPIGEITIDIKPGHEIASLEATDFFELRARYSRVLSFIGFLLSYHNTYGMSISTQHLAGLFESVRSIAQCPELNPENHLSTCLPQSSSSDHLPLFAISVTPRVTYASHHINPLAIGDEDGLLTGLVQAVSAIDIQDTPALELAAERALAAVAPLLLRQWVKMMNSSPVYELTKYCSDPKFVDLALQYWPVTREDQLEGMTQSTLRQLLIIATISVGFASCSEMEVLPNIAVASLYRRANTASGKAAWLDIHASEGFEYLISKLADLVHENQNNIYRENIQSFLQLVVMEHKEMSSLSSRCIGPSSFPTVLRLVPHLSPTQAEFSLILAEIQKQIGTEVDNYWLATQYHPVFMQNGDGLAALCSLLRAFYFTPSKDVNRCAVDIIHSLAQQTEKSWRRNSTFHMCAVTPLIEAVQLVLPSIITEKDASKTLYAFMCDVMDILRPFKKRESEIIEDSLAMLSQIYDVLGPRTTWQDDLADPVFELGQWVDDETQLYLNLEEFLNEEAQPDVMELDANQELDANNESSSEIS